MLSCRETARLVAEDAVGASRFERIGVRLHLLMCRFCRRYRSQLRAMGAASRERFESDDEDSAAARLEHAILEQFRF